MIDLKGKYEAITKAAIESIISKKIKENKAPFNATSQDITLLVMRGVNEILKEMVDSGELKTYKTINFRAYEKTNTINPGSKLDNND